MSGLEGKAVAEYLGADVLILVLFTQYFFRVEVSCNITCIGSNSVCLRDILFSRNYNNLVILGLGLQ
jgi:hypothetical protein